MRPIHQLLEIDHATFDVSHLDAFSVEMVGKGRYHGSPLAIDVLVSCHAYTTRCMAGQQGDLIDYRGNSRNFDLERYNLSLELPRVVTEALAKDAINFIIKDHNQVSNLVLVELENGLNYSVFFCFDPCLNSDNCVQMSVLSAYPMQPLDRTKHKGNRISYHARKSLFSGTRVP